MYKNINQSSAFSFFVVVVFLFFLKIFGVTELLHITFFRKHFWSTFNAGIRPKKGKLKIRNNDATIPQNTKV